ncbi:MAG: 2Fe-2S iron-sulfur cluster-binding protein [Bdellovibrionaceae bacterium]|nr:2Fe-2S iron-sulfur cluster-binding protein [Pseudobdellovibrionaceae bacterium]
MKVKFLPQNLEFNVLPEKTLLQIASENHILIRSLCKGNLTCGECRIRIVEGEHNCIPPTKAELNLLGNNYYLEGRRCACQVRAFGDITVDTSEQMERTDSTRKAVRGFRSEKSVESRAVLDTLILSEKPSHLEEVEVDPLSKDAEEESTKNSSTKSAQPIRHSRREENTKRKKISEGKR